MRACWLKWVGRDWSISADYIWLNYSGANNGTSPVLQSSASDLLIQPDRLPKSRLSLCVNSAWVVSDILQSSALALVTTRLMYMAEHECERRGILICRSWKRRMS